MAIILIFGGGLQAISSARSLKETGHKVVLAACHDKIASRSNYIDEYVDLEDDKDNDKVASELKDIILSRSIEIIIPMEDAQTMSLSQCKSRIERLGVKCAVMDWNVLSWVCDKTQLLSFLEKKGLPHPRTRLLTESNLEEAEEYVGYPALIKPSHSEGAKGIVLVMNNTELKEMYHKVNVTYGACALQEFITTKDYYYNVMLYRGQDGSWGNHCIIKILRYYPVRGGSSSLCITIENDVLLNMCKEVLDQIGWIGFADFDILEKEDNDYRIIEINPRVPASLRAAAVSGINFPEQIVADMMTGKFPFYKYQKGQYLRYLGLDIAWFVASTQRWTSHPSWFKFIGRNLHYQEGGLKDLPAMWASMVEGIKKQLNPQFRKEKSGIQKNSFICKPNCNESSKRKGKNQM